MSNAKLFKDAIADAKALREVAVANAKAALEESFAPRIQSMFERRVMEADDELDEEAELDEKITYEGDKDNLLKSLDETEDMEEGYGARQYEKGKQAGEKIEKKKLKEDEDIDLEELFNSLAEEEDMNEGDYDLEEGEEDLEEGEEDLEEDYDLEEILRELEEEDSLEEGEDEDLNENTMFEKATGDESIEDVTVDELRDMIQDAIKAALGDAGAGADDEEMDMDMDLDMGDEEGGEDEEMDLDIDMEDEGGEEEEKPKKKSKKDELDEIRALYEKKKDEMKKELDERKRYKMNPDKEEMNESDLNAPFGKGKGKSKIGAPYGAAGPKKAGKNGAYSHSLKMKLNEKEGKDIDEAKKKEKELEEAINVIKALRGQLNEVNLLNAKLIYVNKIFKANNLNESQKVKVVNSFDKAQTLTEAKNIYEVIKDNIAAKAPKAPLRESKQIASSIIGGKTANQPIVSDDAITRMQILAGIIKE